MPILIREVQEANLQELQALTVLAFEPIFASFANILGEKIFPLVYPDWKSLQSNLVKTMFGDEKFTCGWQNVRASLLDSLLIN